MLQWRRCGCHKISGGIAVDSVERDRGGWTNLLARAEAASFGGTAGGTAPDAISNRNPTRGEGRWAEQKRKRNQRLGRGRGRGRGGSPSRSRPVSPAASRWREPAPHQCGRSPPLPSPPPSISSPCPPPSYPLREPNRLTLIPPPPPPPRHRSRPAETSTWTQESQNQREERGRGV